MQTMQRIKEAVHESNCKPLNKRIDTLTTFRLNGPTTTTPYFYNRHRLMSQNVV